MLNEVPICTFKCHAKGRAWCISVASMNVTGTWDGSNPFHQALNAHAMIVSSVGRSLEKMFSYQQESKGRLFINNPYRLWNLLQTKHGLYMLGTYCDLARSLWLGICFDEYQKTTCTFPCLITRSSWILRHLTWNFSFGYTSPNLVPHSAPLSTSKCLLWVGNMYTCISLFFAGYIYSQKTIWKIKSGKMFFAIFNS